MWLLKTLLLEQDLYFSTEAPLNYELIVAM